MLNLLLDLPTEVEVDGKIFKIQDDCDWKMAIKCSNALADNATPNDIKIMCVLTMFYEELTLENIGEYAPFIDELIKSMLYIMAYGDMTEKPGIKPVMNFEKDIRLIIEGVNKDHGEIRNKNMHWWTFLACLNGIHDCTYNSVVAIRYKIANHKKLEKHEKEFYNKNKSMIDF